MGKVLSVIVRKANRFNVESRAHKVISQEKPIPAPMHAYAKEQLDKIVKEHPDIVEQHRTKDPNLDDRLKKIYVKSEDPSLHSEATIKEKEAITNLPQDRHSHEDPVYGYYEPAVIPKGRLTLKQAVQIIMDHQKDPKAWTVGRVANEYHLSPNLSENITRYFRAFEIYMPSKDSMQQKVAGPARTSLPPEK